MALRYALNYQAETDGMLVFIFEMTAKMAKYRNPQT